MVEGEIETVVFACSRMRGNEHIMEGFGRYWDSWFRLCVLVRLVKSWRRVEFPFLEARSWRRREDSEQFKAIEIPFSLVCAKEGSQTLPDAAVVLHLDKIIGL